MKSTVVSIVGMVAAVGTLAGVGQADTPTGVDVQAELAHLRAKVAHLEAQAGESWLTEQRAEEIRGLVQDVLADADTRGSLLQNGMTAGHDGKHFFLGSADGNFYLELSGQMQVRFIYNNQDNSSDDNRWGFDNPRTKLDFKGHVVNPDWMYEICGCFGGSSGTFGLGTAYIAHKMGDGWKLQFGQFKPPFLYEELVSSKFQQLVDRSLVNEEFNQDYAQGIQLSYEGDMFRFWAMYNDGFASRNTAWSVEDTEFALTGRVEFLFSGNWGQFKDFNGWPGQEEVGFLVGVAGHYEKDEFGTGDAMYVDPAAMGFDITPNDLEGEVYALTVDASLEFDGANIAGALVYRSVEGAFFSDPLVDPMEISTIDYDQWGFMIQGGVFLNDDWELFARYEYGDYDVEGIEELSALTFGFNRYWARHAAKWTTDIGFGLEEIDSVWSASGVGWRPDASDEDGQIVLRSQFQLLF